MIKQGLKHSTTNFALGDFLIRIKNAAMAKHKELEVRSNGTVIAAAKSLKKLGYLSEVAEAKGILALKLAYRDKEPVLMDLRLVSKPGLRIYMTVSEIESKRGPSTFIISTPKGIVSSKEAKKLRVGGEVLAEIW